MKQSIIVLYSYTTARKAVKYLSGMNINAEITKIAGYRGGCAYGLRVQSKPEKIAAILNSAGIGHKGIISGG